MNRLLSAIDWLLPEEAHADLESRIQARVLVVLMLLAGALSAGVGSLRLVIGSDAGVGVIGVVCGLLLVPLLWAYRRTGVTGRVGDVLVFLALAAIFGSAWLEGGTAASSAIWFAAVPMWAAFLGGAG
jgi:hypothetical protein